MAPASKEIDVNGARVVTRDIRGRFVRGSASPSPGRPRGSLSKVHRSLKQAIELAFENLGAEAWLEDLARTDPTTFAALLSKLLPPAKAEHDTSGPVTIEVLAGIPAPWGSNGGEPPVLGDGS